MSLGGEGYFVKRQLLKVTLVPGWYWPEEGKVRTNRNRRPLTNGVRKLFWLSQRSIPCFRGKGCAPASSVLVFIPEACLIPDSSHKPLKLINWKKSLRCFSQQTAWDFTLKNRVETRGWWVESGRVCCRSPTLTKTARCSSWFIHFSILLKLYNWRWHTLFLLEKGPDLICTESNW